MDRQWPPYNFDYFSPRLYLFVHLILIIYIAKARALPFVCCHHSIHMEASGAFAARAAYWQEGPLFEAYIPAD